MRKPRKNYTPVYINEGTYQVKKITWGALTGAWVSHDTRDVIIDFVRYWSERTEIPVQRFLGWLGIAANKFHDWRSDP